MKTVTLERYHLHGTRHHELRLTYRGETLKHWEKGYHVYKQAVHDGSQEQIDNFRAYAKARGFTHIRVAGDWERYTKPEGGKL